MISIQHNLMDMPLGSMMSPVKQEDSIEAFEHALDAVALNEVDSIATQPLDSNNQVEESIDDFLRLDSDISMLEDIMTKYTLQAEQVQPVPVNVMHEHIQKEILLASAALKKSELKKLEIDGTEVNASMMVPLVPIEVLYNPVTLTTPETKRDGESLRVDLKDNDSQEAIVNLESMNLASMLTSSNIEAKVDTNVDIKINSKDASATVLTTKEMLTEDATKETTLLLSISKEVGSHDPIAELTPTAETVSRMMDKSIPTVSIKTRSSEIQSHDDTLKEEVPIVSIALKRAPVMQRIPGKTSDIAPKNETLTVDPADVSKPKISDEVTQVVKLTEPEKEYFEGDSEEVEPLIESSVKEAVIKPIQSGAASESSDVSTEVNVSKSAPIQQLQQAILDAKEGVSPKESKTLTVVLNPEELGAVNVELTADETGKLTAVLSVEKKETLDALQQDLHQLKTVLKEIGIDESSVSLQLSSNNEQGQQKQSEYVAWEEREQMLARSSHTSIKTTTVEKATYPERQRTRRLDIKA